MKIKKIQFSTRISDLYGRDKYQSHIKVGDEFWYYFSDDSNVFQETHKHWNKIKITYMRSGCLFYMFPDNPNVPEEFCPVNCYMASAFVLAYLDPVKDLKCVIDNIDTDVSKLMYCFNDEHTVVKNWNNEKETEVDDKLFDKLDNTKDWLGIKLFEK